MDSMLRADERVNAGRRQAAAAFLVQPGEPARAVLALIDVDRLEPGDPLLGVLGHAVIGIMHVDVLGIAAACGQFDREERRGLGRARVVGVVGMERLTGDDSLAIHNLLVGDVLDIRVPGDVTLFLVMGMKLAEQPRSSLELVRREVLVPHDHDVMIGKAALEGNARLDVDRLGEIEPDKLEEVLFTAEQRSPAE
jgi:hypothetical protein